MAAAVRRPAVSPCGSCPYRVDVPSGVWDETEYDKLPEFDNETWAQPPSVFMCHQQDGRICAGWAGCHDMAESFGLRIAAASELISEDDLTATLDYVCPVPLWGSGAEARDHGLTEIEQPSTKARRTIQKLERRTWEDEIRAYATKVGLPVKTCRHDPVGGWKVQLEDGQEIESDSTVGVKRLLLRLSGG